MSTESGHTPAKTAETLSSIVAALAAEQIAQGGISLLWEKRDVFSGARVLLVLGATILLLLTLLRFYHGNSAYLHRRYHRWNHSETMAGAALTMPYQYLVDNVAHLFQYLTLAASGYLLARDETLLAVGWSYVTLMVLDVLWTLWALSQHPDRETERALTLWAKINAVVGVALFIGFLGWQANTWTVLALMGSMAGQTAYDYLSLSNFYFASTTADASVRGDSACASVTYLAAVIAAQRVPSKHPTDPKARLREQLDRCFAYFMESPAKRSDLFARGKDAKLTVGVYIETDGMLCPVYRYCDAGLKISNRSFHKGQDFIGGMYVRLLNDPVGGVVIASRSSEDRPALVVEEKMDAVQYRSSAMANLVVHLPDGSAEAIGILTITADQDSYFTPNLHEALAVALGRAVVGFLESAVAPTTPLLLREELIKLASPDPLVTVRAPLHQKKRKR